MSLHLWRLLILIITVFIDFSHEKVRFDVLDDSHGIH